MKKKKDEITIRSSAAEYLTYVASVGDQQGSIEMRYEDENIWLTQKMMATLYDVDVRTINEHIKKIYSDSELEEDSTIRNFRIVQTEGSRQVTRDTKHYNLQMIIAVGFKVNSERAVQFRKWVNQIAKDYTITGWVMDDERLKRGTYLTEKYFDEQLERIREIRAMKGGKPIFAFDFQNDGEYVGGCIAGGRNYCHINPNGDVEPCVFIHYSGANIKEVDLLTALKQPLFMAYRENQPFNCNHLKPCPMLENPEILQHMVHETKAHSTDLQSPESVEHLCGKCAEYAKKWDVRAQELWQKDRNNK